MGNTYVREDGSLSKVIPVRLPEEVYKVYEARAVSEDFTVGVYVKRLLVKLAKADSRGGIATEQV